VGFEQRRQPAGRVRRERVCLARVAHT
jgi:hypothetical protein